MNNIISMFIKFLLGRGLEECTIYIERIPVLSTSTIVVVIVGGREIRDEYIEYTTTNKSGLIH